MIYTTYFHSPIGFLRVITSSTALTSVEFCEEIPTDAGTEQHPQPKVMTRAVQQLKEYFEGTRLLFQLPIRPEGTAFQCRVWDELFNIPFGNTVSYRTISIRLGDEKCIRAAASANGRNPIAVIIPCHRVIGTDGKLVGYAGGLWRKKWLLQHEMSLFKPEGQLF